ncbi:hypothetical protein DUZ99_10565 [Xylanibacillus composti]|uniref:Uncharacterized protein n=1 Tax=Xylanibacillus composti TaxID=1572762 RepID=A0A8J4H7J9_9BACL|nr:hypothetical protein [Xylanibacillus composti]MDT9725413.1 hypothetical protein [Xylanibacillus composti]GIQ71456.1 hypothetical protein XYCOK13_42800 [Xylanibacillus composti]
MQEWLRILLFHLLTAVEGSAVFLLMIKLFRFSIREWWKEILFAVLFTSYVNYHLWHIEFLTGYVYIIQVGMLYLFNWLVLRCNWLHAVIVLCTGFAAYTLIQVVVLYIFNFMGVFSTEKLDGTQPYTTYVHQLTSAVIGWVVISLLTMRRIGFTFVTGKKRGLTDRRLWSYIAIFTVGMIIPAVVYFVYLKVGGLSYAMGFLIAQLCSLSLFIAFAFRSEKQKYLSQRHAYLKGEK